MKFSAPADALRSAFRKIDRAIEGKNVIPILGSIRFEATGSTASVTASDYDLTITATVEANVDDPGIACIPAAELTKLVGLAKKSSIRIETTDRIATVSFGRSSAELLVFPATDFPNLPDYSSIDLQDVDGDLLARALKFTAVAMANEDTRDYLMGVQLRGHDGGTIATATDGHRLHRAIMPTLAIEGMATIPSKHVPVLAGIVADDGRVQFAISDRSWAVVTDTVKARGSVIEGTFPDADRIIASDAQISALADREALREAILIAATGASKTGNTVHVVLTIAGDEIAVHGFRPGDALAKGVSTAMAADTKSPITSTYNSAYLQEALRAIDCDRVAILNAGTLIIHVEPVEQAVELRLKAVVMGIRASDQEMAA